MKKTMGIVLSFILFLTSTTGTAYAFSNPQGSEDNKSLEYYAYMDIDTAPKELKEKILEARNSIIYSKSWSTDGYKCSIVDVKTGEVIEELPDFSEIFPDWDVPVENTEFEFTTF